MKILFDNRVPFLLAHGGVQIQIEQTWAALEKLGVEVEPLRWWDEHQTGDILHQFGRMEAPIVALAQKKGWKVAITLLLTETVNRSDWGLFKRQLTIRTALAAPISREAKMRLPWQAYRICDRVIVGLEAERMVLEKVYGIGREKISVIPLGLTDAHLNAGAASRSEEHLICTGTIGPPKNSIELARLAVAAKTPMLFVGKPLNLTDPYWLEFEKLIDGKFIRHHPHVTNGAELIALLQKARGYVLKSRFENWSLAAHEAAACGLPMLVPDQRWSRERFADQATYWPRKDGAASVTTLRKFYDACPSLPAPRIKLYSWANVGEMMRQTYLKMLGRTTP